LRTSPEGAAAGVSGVAQFRQNRARSGFSSPQFGQWIMWRSVRAANRAKKKKPGEMPGFWLGWCGG